MKLSNRLLKIAQKVPRGVKMADIGTDHAYLPIYLIKKGCCPSAIATEVKPGPFRRAMVNLRREKLEHLVDLRLGSGFAPLIPGEAKVAVVAGMGGEVIADIVKNHREVAEAFDAMILQPMTKIKHLRRELYALGFEILDEDIAQEGKRFYEILVAKRGTPKSPKSSDIVLGPVLKQRRDELVLRYFHHRCHKLEKMLYQIQKEINRENSSIRTLEEYEYELKLLREVIR